MTLVDKASAEDMWDGIKALQDIDRRVCYFLHERDRSSQAAGNTGIQAAKSEHVAFLDPDNEWCPLCGGSEK